MVFPKPAWRITESLEKIEIRADRSGIYFVKKIYQAPYDLIGWI